MKTQLKELDDRRKDALFDMAFDLEADSSLNYAERFISIFKSFRDEGYDLRTFKSFYHKAEKIQDSQGFH